VVGTEREPGPYHDTVTLVDPAWEPLATLLATASPRLVRRDGVTLGGHPGVEHRTKY
jgi:hypothetical protein